MIKGIDVSHWNNSSTIEQAMAKDKIDFVIAKATEGKRTGDVKFKHFVSVAEKNNLLIGAYHYARPEMNEPLDEARNFLDTVNQLKGACVFALDWEGKALQCNPKWALDWCKFVQLETGVKPLVYVQESATHLMGDLAANDYGLWVAKWGINKPEKLGKWKFWAMWQYSDKPYDLDYFNGTREQFKKYM